jgi:uncharacterized protein YggE
MEGLAGRTVSVTATGRATTTPDRLVVGFAVWAAADAPAAALQQAADAAEALNALLDRRGVPAEHRTTTGLAVNPRYDHNHEQVTSHYASYSLRVTLGSTQEVDPLLQEAAATLGSSLRIDHVSLAVSDLLPALRQARDNAVAEALETAAQLATAASVRLGALQTLEEHVGDRMQFFVGEVSGRVGGLVEPGEHEVSVTVSAVFALEA